ncbi:hypothetical protein ACFO5X_03165 [Seohaeicola nanhaiensis]|uniref:DUF3465 domain-containing protein n=1 Tax=Seohaeicola nanhaiensis TaxID=1387282 RepID=A0ABV9KBH6_9RHOB
MSRFSNTCLICMTLAGQVGSVMANETSDNAAKAIAGIVALGVIGNANAKHQHQRGYEEYKPHPQVHRDENTVGACIHNGERIAARAGGWDFRLEGVREVYVQGDITHVVFHGTGYYSYGHNTSLVQCPVRHGKVIHFNYS